ncbi:MAG TPA: thioredoxin family protein [Candidatus Deferrimicrobium sp.]|nr:thioredoxin family protein [Candidatus Deferrimicrobium sp.]
MTEKSLSKAVKIEIYTSPTCPYCPAALVMLQKAVSLYGNHIAVTQIDVTTPEGEELAAFYQVQATPTIVIQGDVKFRGPPSSEIDLFEDIESYLDEETIKKARKTRKDLKREIDMMYG